MKNRIKVIALTKTENHVALLNKGISCEEIPVEFSPDFSGKSEKDKLNLLLESSPEKTILKIDNLELIDGDNKLTFYGRLSPIKDFKLSQDIYEYIQVTSSSSEEVRKKLNLVTVGNLKHVNWDAEIEEVKWFKIFV